MFRERVRDLYIPPRKCNGLDPSWTKKRGSRFQLLSCWITSFSKGRGSVPWMSNQKGKPSVLLHSYLTNIFTKINKHMGRAKNAKLDLWRWSFFTVTVILKIFILIEVIVSTMQFCKYSLQVLCSDGKYSHIVCSLLFPFCFERTGLLNSI